MDDPIHFSLLGQAWSQRTLRFAPALVRSHRQNGTKLRSGLFRQSGFTPSHLPATNSSRWAAQETVMKLLDQIHEGYVYDRRTRVLSARMAQLLPENSRVLDIGCGDGLISKSIQEKRADIAIEGIDVLLRPETHIPV